MTRRVRRTRYRGEVREQIEAERAEADAAAAGLDDEPRPQRGDGPRGGLDDEGRDRPGRP